eukprot:3607595-Pyramimonas_sp.AAC.1
MTSVRIELGGIFRAPIGVRYAPCAMRKAAASCADSLTARGHKSTVGVRPSFGPAACGQWPALRPSASLRRLLLPLGGSAAHRQSSSTSQRLPPPHLNHLISSPRPQGHPRVLSCVCRPAQDPIHCAPSNLRNYPPPPP